jgi:hypothetical protein
MRHSSHGSSFTIDAGRRNGERVVPVDGAVVSAGESAGLERETDGTIVTPSVETVPNTG